jgi:protoporphyrinogen oxidase
VNLRNFKPDRTRTSVSLKGGRQEPLRVGILGGGLTGLTIAYRLRQKAPSRFRVEVLEKESECGGLLRSVLEDGFTFDSGGAHIIYSKDKRAVNFMLQVLGNNYFRKRRNNKVYFRERFVKYPFENGLSDLSPEDNFECLYHFLNDRYPKPKDFRQWIYSTFGRGIAEKYLIPYNRKIWNYPLEKMSLHWVEGRVPRPPAEDVIKSALGIPTEGYTHQLYFYYPRRGGIQALIKSMERQVPMVLKDYAVNKVLESDGTWKVSDGRISLSYDVLISTIPIFDLISAMNGVPLKVKSALKRLKCNSLLTVMLGLKGNPLSEYTALYFPDPRVRFNRVGFPHVFSRFNVPPGKSSLVAEITTGYNRQAWKLSDRQLVREVTDALHQRKLIDKRSVCFARVKRSQYAYVVYDKDYQKNARVVLRYAGDQGIWLCGRFSEFEYLNMDACVSRAIGLADRLIKLSRMGRTFTRQNRKGIHT